MDDTRVRIIIAMLAPPEQPWFVFRDYEPLERPLLTGNVANQRHTIAAWHTVDDQRRAQYKKDREIAWKKAYVDLMMEMFE